MARQFGYYDDWKLTILECPRCGWKGTFEQGSVEYHDELMDSSCPTCDLLSAPMLAIVSFPTIRESEQNWEKLSDREKSEVLERKRFLAEREASSLISSGQLPELPGPTVVLAWDWVEVEAGHFTVIRHGNTEVWREPAFWEGYERFREVVEILRQKYGKRLVDVIPTPASTLYLYGDKLGAPDFVARVRESLKGWSGQQSA